MPRNTLALVIVVIGSLEALLFPFATGSGFSLFVFVFGVVGTLLSALVWWKTAKGSFIGCIAVTWGVLSVLSLTMNARPGDNVVFGNGFELVGWSVFVGFAWAMVLLLPVGLFYAATKDVLPRPA